MSEKKILLIGIAVLLMLLIPLGLHIQGSNNISPPKMWVTNDIINDMWREYNEFQSFEFEDTFWYRLNFSFPQQRMGGQPLRSFYVIGEIDSNISILNQEQIRIYTVKGSIDVTEYFEILTTFTSKEYSSIGSITIVALDTALKNAQFYGNRGDLYVVFEVEMMGSQYDSEYDDPQLPVPEEELMLDTELQTPIIVGEPLPEDGAFDPPKGEVIEVFGDYRDDYLIVKMSSFQVVGEFFSGERFHMTSNNVYTYIHTARFR